MATTDTAKISSIARFYSIKSFTYCGRQTASDIFHVQLFVVVPIGCSTIEFFFFFFLFFGPNISSNSHPSDATSVRVLKNKHTAHCSGRCMIFPHYYVRIKNITYCRTVHAHVPVVSIYLFSSVRMQQ